jgi:hypothetical protein
MIRVRGIGPLYWGIEHDSSTPRSSYAWVVETTPPYRKSTWGHQFRLGHTSVHFGLCTKETDPEIIALHDGKAVETNPKVIGTWYMDEVSPEEFEPHQEGP